MAKFQDILLTVDYDRTLTAPDSTIPEANLAAIRYFMAEGGAFTVNTGRSLPMAQAFLGKVEANAPFLLYNGSAAYDPATGKLSQLREIPRDPWATVRECARLFPDSTVEVQGVDAHYQISGSPQWADFCIGNGCAFRQAVPEDTLRPFLKFSVYGDFRGCTVAQLFSATPEELRRFDEIQRTLEEQFGPWCEVFRAAPRIIDVHAKGVSKCRSARDLQKHLGRKLLVCVGDADNDLPMLDGADYAFVPGDSPLAGKYPTVCPCGEGAVADVILHRLAELPE